MCPVGREAMQDAGALEGLAMASQAIVDNVHHQHRAASARPRTPPAANWSPRAMAGHFDPVGRFNRHPGRTSWKTAARNEAASPRPSALAVRTDRGSPWCRIWRSRRAWLPAAGRGLSLSTEPLV